MYVIDKTLRSCFRNSSALLFFFELFRTFLGVVSIKPPEYTQALLSTPSVCAEHFLIWCLWSDTKSRIYARIGVGTLHSHLTNLESTFEAVLSAVRFNYCFNIARCLHFSRNTQILELGSYAHGDEPNLNTSSHCILDMRTIGVEWVVSL